MKSGIQTENEIANKVNSYTRTEVEKFNAILQAKYDEDFGLDEELLLALTQEEKQRFERYRLDLDFINDYQAKNPQFDQRNLYLTLYKKGPADARERTCPATQDRTTRQSERRHSGVGLK